MKLIIQNNAIAATASDEYQANGTEQEILTAPADFNQSLMAEYQYANGAVTIPAPNPVPQSISNAQGQMALYNIPSGSTNLLAVIESYLNTATKPQQIAFSATTWQRTSPSLNSLATAIGLTSAQVDSLFIAAAQIII